MTPLLHALAEPRRRRIVELVWDHEISAGEIHRALPDVTFGAVSQHLTVLRQAGVVTARTAGRHRYYRAQREALAPLRAWLESMWDRALADLTTLAEAEAIAPPSKAPSKRRNR